MHHIAEGCRHQMEISSLDCNIDTENVVRFIDAFICKLNLVKLKFEGVIVGLIYYRAKSAINRILLPLWNCLAR